MDRYFRTLSKIANSTAAIAFYWFCIAYAVITLVVHLCMVFS